MGSQRRMTETWRSATRIVTRFINGVTRHRTDNYDSPEEEPTSEHRTDLEGEIPECGHATDGPDPQREQLIRISHSLPPSLRTGLIIKPGRSAARSVRCTLSIGFRLTHGVLLATDWALFGITTKQRNSTAHLTPINLPFSPIRIRDDLGRKFVACRSKLLMGQPLETGVERVGHSIVAQFFWQGYIEPSRTVHRNSPFRSRLSWHTTFLTNFGVERL